MKYIGTFTTESGNIYLYDGTSNMVLPINKEIASIVENTVELDRNKIREVANTNIKNIIDKWNLFSKPTSMYLSESEITTGNPKDMPGFHIDDVGRISVTIMQFELINTQKFRGFFRLDQLSIISSIQFPESLFIDILYGILTKAGKFSHFLVCINTGSE